MLPANINNVLPKPQDFPALFSRYTWDKYHAAFGWPPDSLQNGFAWIVSLEERFSGVLAHENEPPINLVAEMILWGGNQNNILEKYAEGFRANPNQYGTLIQSVILNLANPKPAIISALDIPGFGLTYGSKLLRFCRPTIYGALDRRIREALGQNLRRIHDSHPQSMCAGYIDFLELLHQYQQELRQAEIVRPTYGLRATTLDWMAAEIEMALFAWASGSQTNNSPEEGNRE